MKARWGIIFALWFLALVNYLERVAMSFAGPSIMSSLDMTPAQFGMILSSFSIGFFIAQIPGGLLADRWGFKLMLVLSPICWAAFSGITGLVTSFFGFLLARICLGLSEGASNTSLYKAIGDQFRPEDRSRVLGICSTAIPIAPAIAGIFVSNLLLIFGWRMMFIALVLPAIIAAIIAYSLIPSRPPTTNIEDHCEPVDSFRDVLKLRTLWIISMACFAWNIPYWGFLGWMPTYLVMAHHVDLKSLGVLGSIPYVFAFLGLIIGGWLGSGSLHKFCAHIASVFFMAAGISLYVAYQGESIFAVLAGLSGAAFFLFGSNAPIGKLALDLAPERYRASYVGFYNTFGHIGGAIAPAAIGFLVSYTGTFAAGFGLMIVGLGVATICLISLLRFLAINVQADSERTNVRAVFGHR